VEYRDDKEMPGMIFTRSVDGVVTMGMQAPRFVRDVAERGMPIVLVDPFDSALPAPQIVIDNRQGAALAVRHIKELGHREVGLLLGDLTHSGVQERNDSYRRELKEAGLACHEQLMDWLGYERGYEGMKQLLSRQPHLTAVLAGNDETALGAIRALEESGRRVPRDISVIGFDNILEAEQRRPALTTINVDKRLMGALAVRKLLRMMEGGEPEPRQEVVAVSFVLRSTTGPPREK